MTFLREYVTLYPSMIL